MSTGPIRPPGPQPATVQIPIGQLVSAIVATLAVCGLLVLGGLWAYNHVKLQSPIVIVPVTPVTPPKPDTPKPDTPKPFPSTLLDDPHAH